MRSETPLYDSPDERAAFACELARQLERVGEYEQARDALYEWWTIAAESNANSISDQAIRAEVLLRVGSLTGWLGSTSQMAGAQEAAKTLITKSLEIFDNLRDREKAIEARSELALCHWREGALDDARVLLETARSDLKDDESEGRVRLSLLTAMVETSAGRRHDALRTCREALPVAELIPNPEVKGRLHNQLASLYAHLGRTESREDYLDIALVEYTAASFYFEQAGMSRYEAMVENNVGFLFLTLDRPKDARDHLDRARIVFKKLGDLKGVAQVDESRARVLISEKRYEEAERLSHSAAKIVAKGDEDRILAEMLITRGISLARMGKYSLAQTVLERSMEVSMNSGDRENTAVAALTILEELASHISPVDRSSLFGKASELLTFSQQSGVLRRLINCAREVFIPHLHSSKRQLRVFLCHAKDDKQAVQELYKRLVDRNVDPWLDEEKLLPGQDWDLEIAKAVRESDVVIVCLSQKSTNKTGFVQKEIKYALDVADQQPEGSIFLIPLRLEKCIVPDRLKRLQWVDFFKYTGFTRLVNSLTRKAIELSLAPPQV